MNRNIRVRFAPSPTGPLHIGGVRTALYNYLFAKRHGGTFILRIEDTDRKRFVPGAEDYIIEALNWAGIPYDEGPRKEGTSGPYRQSERSRIYQKHIRHLLDTGKAYYAFDTPEELDAARKQAESRGETFAYDGHSRGKMKNSISLTGKQTRQLLESGTPYVIRFKMPGDRELTLYDEIRGEVRVNTSLLDDKVLFKSDGLPTYHFANIVDDHLMQITHVIRGEEWLPSLALHHLLYEAMGWEPPVFAHLPLILKPTGKGKLSKRDGDKHGFAVFPLAYRDPRTGETSRGYREDGFFPEAMINMLALLGWNPGDEREIMDLEELTRSFELKRVNKSGAKFDPQKTLWFQQQYMHRKDTDSLTDLFAAHMESATEVSAVECRAFQEKDRAYHRRVVALLHERAVFVRDFWEQGRYFYLPPAGYDPKAVKKAWKEDTPTIMKELTEVLREVEPFDSPDIETRVKAWIGEKELSFGKVLMPFRLSLVGSMSGPHVFDIAAMIGKDETLARIHKAEIEMGK